MGIKIYYGDRVEALRDRMVERLGGVNDPFESREIVVPNGNVAKWLKIEIARTKGVTMGLEFPFLDKFLSKTMMSAIPDFRGRKVGLIDVDELTLAIGRILAENVAETTFAPFFKYCGIRQGEGADVVADLAKVDVARKFWQLAGTLARYLSEYDCRRTADMDAWAGELPATDPRWKYVRLADRKDDGTPIGKNDYGADAKPLPDADRGLVAAQRVLFRKLFAADGLYPSKRYGAAGDAVQAHSLRQIFNRFKEEVEPTGLAARCGSQKIVLFGVSTIAPLQAEIIYQLAKKGAEVEVYYLTVCTELWDDIETNRERQWKRIREARGWKKVADAKLKTDADGSFEKLDFGSVDDGAYENPILSSLGTAGRETMRLFIEMESADVPVEMELCGDGVGNTDSMLGKVQHGVCHRVSGLETERQHQDDSMQIVRAPGINREVEMVYNAILGDYLRAKEKGEWFDFSEVAVLVPDMKKYRPVFKQVFGARGKLPYGLVDPSASAESFYAAGLSALLGLDAATFTRSGVLAVLSNPCVQKARHIAIDDFAHWVELVDRLGVHRGFSDDAPAGSAAVCSGSFAFTWNHALKRLRLGKMISSVPSETRLGVPYGDIDSENCGESLSVNVEELYDAIAELRGTGLRTIADWCKAIEELTEEWMAIPDERREEVVMERSVGSMLAGLRTAFEGDVREYPIDFVLGHVRQTLGSVPVFEGGQYLTQGVTIAPLSSMRGVPFREVYILGLGEAEFPGAQSRSRLNLKQCRACLGDATVDNVNRHFFLETLMSVRDRLVLSYDGEDTAKDEKKYPSSVIRLIEDYLAQHVLKLVKDDEGKEEPAKFMEVELPLLERDLAAVEIESDNSLAELEKRIVTTYSNIQRQQARMDVGRVLGKGKGAAGKTDSSGKDNKTTIVKGKDVEIPIKWLAEFLKEPRKTVLKRRLKVYDESKTDVRRADDEPIDPAEYKFYPVKDRLLLKMFQGKFPDEEARDAEVRTEYQLLERSAQVGGGLIGEYSFLRSLKADVDALCANAQFSAFLGAHMKLAEDHRPLRVRLPMTLDDGQAVVLTGEMPIYWIDGCRLTMMTKRSDAKKNFIKNTVEQLLFCAAIAAGGELACGELPVESRPSQFELHCFDDKSGEARMVNWGDAESFLKGVASLFAQDADCVFLPIGLENVKKAYDDAKKAGEEDVDCAVLLESAQSGSAGGYGNDDRVSPIKNIIEALAEECDQKRILTVMEKMKPFYLALFRAAPGEQREEKKSEVQKASGKKKSEVK